ncbi:LOW QUALITY PROTEIN: hypothetical protein SETIT_4G168100v2 [Setaria italica]|uniref:Uncharacterized protein n=1 Tax=Setaria italica TaxID=4555 RepID=A0A368QV28_SETIT|nr:LOW QUALITY PROTEIN: hypothetical protein SETIT_4G168100v2 [Setaria italica]
MVEEADIPTLIVVVRKQAPSDATGHHPPRALLAAAYRSLCKNGFAALAITGDGLGSLGFGGWGLGAVMSGAKEKVGGGDRPGGGCRLRAVRPGGDGAAGWLVEDPCAGGGGDKEQRLGRVGEEVAAGGGRSGIASRSPPAAAGGGGRRGGVVQCCAV